MTETQARQVVLVQAYDAAPGPLWTAEDAQWATRLANESVPAESPPAAWAAERARHALQRLLPRDPAAARWLDRPVWRWRWLAVALGLGLAAGLATDLIGRSRHVDVLAPVVWSVVLWNLAIYAVLLLHGLRRPTPGSGWLRRMVAGWWQRGAPGQGPLAAAARRWSEVGDPLLQQRAATLVHAAAACLGLGLLAGLYLRGLVFDYRAAWESTFLEPGIVHAVLGVLMGPAVAVTGLSLPDVEAITAMRLTPQSPEPRASAGLWIHLYAATLLLTVVLPRTLLALSTGAAAALRARRVVLPAAVAGLWPLDAGRRGGPPPLVQVLPYAQTPAAQSALGLRQLLASVLGESMVLKMADVTSIGSEDSVVARAGPPGTTLRVALIDMTATPEAEHHGRLCAALSLIDDEAGWLLMVDEAAYRARFGSLPGRLTERRDAWQAFAAAQRVRLAIVNLDQPELPEAAAALRAALSSADRDAGPKEARAAA
jgi:hypothetical protein